MRMACSPSEPTRWWSIGPGTLVEVDPSSEISVTSSEPLAQASVVSFQKRTLLQSPVHTGAWSVEPRSYSDQSPETSTARAPPPGEAT